MVVEIYLTYFRNFKQAVGTRPYVSAIAPSLYSMVMVMVMVVLSLNDEIISVMVVLSLNDEIISVMVVLSLNDEIRVLRENKIRDNS